MEAAPKQSELLLALCCKCHQIQFKYSSTDLFFCNCAILTSDLNNADVTYNIQNINYLQMDNETVIMQMSKDLDTELFQRYLL